MTHSPAPWKVESTLKILINDAEGNTIVAAPGSSTGTLIEMQANAQLIAAAPDMLIALRGILAALTQPKTYPADVDAAKAFAERAIAKAEGRAS